MCKDLLSNKPNELKMALGLTDKTPIDLFYDNPCEKTLREIPKSQQNYKMIQLAVENDGTAIKSASKKLITEELCKTAVMQNGLALEYIPSTFYSNELFKLAVKNNGLAISFVPKKNRTKTLAKIAVSQSIELSKYDFYNYPISYIPERLIDEKLVETSITHSPCSLGWIPKQYITKELLFLAVSKDVRALYFVPPTRRGKKLIKAALENDPRALKFAPKSKCTKEICDIAFNKNPFVIKWIPEKHITLEMCLYVIEESNNEDKNKTIDFEWFPYEMLNNKTILDAIIKKYGAEKLLLWNMNKKRPLYGIGTLEERTVETEYLSKDTIEYLKNIILKVNAVSLSQITAEVNTPSPSPEAMLVQSSDNLFHIYELAHSDNASTKTIYYISDLHLEHQLKNILKDDDLDFEKIDIFLTEKIKEMIPNTIAPYDYLLVGGDVAHTKLLLGLFYQKLLHLCKGNIISILGNHELWDDHPEGSQNGYISKPIDKIIDLYRSNINSLNPKLLSLQNYWGQIFFLQNSILINYKNRQHCIIDENQILSASDEDLKKVLSESTFILLGGIGFSGLDQHFNAESGLYRAAVTTLEEDKKLSAQFRFIYDKLNRCAGDKQVIVLTHTPVYNWTNEPCNPNWVYVNGHTHQNSLIRKADGTTVLSDNQVGYNPSKWKLNCFTVSGWYDPFKDLKDGIHEITSDMYKDFNIGRGIKSNGCSFPGTIYALKRNGLYMFVLQSKSSLCLLVGGQRNRLNNCINYYYDNMELYVSKVYKAITPYQNALKAMSNEIISIGGWGTIHGCIIDIDYFNHIFLNPYDGKITAYHAINKVEKYTYTDLPTLLKSKLPQLSEKFEFAKKSGIIPLIEQHAISKKESNEKKSIVTVPSLVLDTKIYEPSRIIKSFQYILDHNVIRVWDDRILTADFNAPATIKRIEERSKKLND